MIERRDRPFETLEEAQQVLDLLSTVVCLHCLDASHTTAEHDRKAEDPSFVPPLIRMRDERDKYKARAEKMEKAIRRVLTEWNLLPFCHGEYDDSLNLRQIEAILTEAVAVE